MRLDRFWRLLEALPRHSLILGEWRHFLETEFEEAAQLFLAPSSRLSPVYPCPSPGGDGCPRRVVIHGPGDVVAVCNDVDQYCDRLELTEADIVLYDLDLRSLRDQMRQALHLLGRFEACQMARTWRLGNLQLQPLNLWPVYLHLPLTIQQTRSTLLALLVESRDPFVFLTPTSDQMPNDVLDLLHAQGGKWMALAELLMLEDQRLVSEMSLAELLGGPGDPPSSVGPEYAFRRQGDYWEAIYQKERVLIRHQKGIHYLLVLLRNPGRSYNPSALTLEAGEVLAGLPCVGVLEDGLHMSSSGAEDPLLDRRAISEYRRRLREIESELEAASGQGNYAKREELQASKEFLQRELASAVGLDGQGRKSTDAYRRVRDRVNRALRRALASVADHPALSLHLSTALHSGAEWTYRPEIELPWEF